VPSKSGPGPKSVMVVQLEPEAGTVVRSYVQDGVNKEESKHWTGWGWRNEEGSWFHR